MTPRRGANAGRRVHAPVQPVPPLAERLKPGLVDTCTGTKSPDRCQQCDGKHTKHNPLVRYLEHDAMDRVPEYPEKPRAIVLCTRCADRIIEPHPRMYTQLVRGEPMPGTMGVCLGCAFRDGVSCSNPDARLNGGTGLEYTWDAEPYRAHIQACGRDGRRRSGYVTMYPSPVRTCSGHRETPSQ